MVCIGEAATSVSSPRSRPSIQRVWSQGLAAGFGDDLERMLGGGYVGPDDVPADAGLYSDQGHAVRDDVVQLPGDPQPLLDDGPSRQLPSGGRFLLRDPQPLGLLGAARADCVAECPRGEQQGTGLQEVGCAQVGDVQNARG